MLTSVRDSPRGCLSIPREQLVIIARRIFRQVVDDVARGCSAESGILRDARNDLLDEALVQRDLLRAVFVQLVRNARIAEDIAHAPLVFVDACGVPIVAGPCLVGHL